MKFLHQSFAIFLLSSLLSLSAWAEYKPMPGQQNPSSEKGMDMGKGKSMDMGMGMSEEMKDKHARAKQLYILKIDILSDQINEEKNPEKKQALMDEQLLLIKDHMEKKMQMKKMMMKKHHQKMMNQKSMNM